LRALVPLDPALVPPEKRRNQVLISSAALPCSYIVIEPSGHIAGTVQHRVIGTRKVIADFRIHTIEQYERRAREILVAAKAGRNLLAEEKAAAARQALDLTVLGLIEKYLAESAIRKQRSFAKEQERYLRKVWVRLHGFSAETILRSDIVSELRKIADKHGESSANRAKSKLAAMFRYGQLHGWLNREHLPVDNLPTWAENERERVLALKELALVWRFAPEVLPAYGVILRLLILTGCRLEEIAQLRWSEISLDEGDPLIKLPSHRTKNAREHWIPLVPTAVEILQAWPRRGEEDRLFPNIDWSWRKLKLDDKQNLSPHWVVHDLRRTFSTGCREYLDPVPDEHLVEICLGHARSGVKGTYDRSLRLKDRRVLLGRWADCVLSAVSESVETAQGGDV
jgi:integrase